MAQQSARRGRKNQVYSSCPEHAFMIWFRSANSHTGPQLHRCIRGRTDGSIRLRANLLQKPLASGGASTDEYMPLYDTTNGESSSKLTTWVISPQARPYSWHKAASGQTRKSALVTAKSAFPPIATKLRTSREVRFVPGTDMKSSLQYIVGDSQERGRNFDAQRFGGFQIDDECELGRLFDREVCWN
jgi:hypothetical protein